MVTRALRKFNPRARVNERHDIVLDQGDLVVEQRRPDAEDMHRTAYSSGDTSPRKISGSAFKLTKDRSLHHGTCLLGSDLSLIRKCLNSDARPYVKARGVDSVRSPVGNLLSSSTSESRHAVIKAVINQFGALYGLNIEGWNTIFPTSQ